MAWFKRKDKGIQTPTEAKKIFLKDYGTNLPLEKLLIQKS